MISAMIDSIEQEIPRLRRFARCLVRDPDLADDVVQQCLIRALDRVDTWRFGANLRPCLLAILHGCRVDHARRAAPSGESHAWPAARLRHPRRGDPAPPTPMEIRDAFMSLKEEEREILLLVVVEALDYGQVAAILGISVATVRARLASARQALRSASGHRPLMPVAQVAG